MTLDHILIPALLAAPLAYYGLDAIPGYEGLVIAMFATAYVAATTGRP